MSSLSSRFRMRWSPSMLLLLINVAVLYIIHPTSFNLANESCQASTKSTSRKLEATRVFQKIAITCWKETCEWAIGVSGTAILEALGYSVSHVLVNFAGTTTGTLIEQFKDQDAVLWWSWDFPEDFTPADLSLVRSVLPRDQVWGIFNWDDPHVWSDNAHPRRRRNIKALASHLDIVYTSGSSVIEKYIELGVSEAKFVMVPYTDLFHHYNPDPNLMACDINFIATNYYDGFENLAASRRAIVKALTQASDLNVFIYGLSSEGFENKDAFKGSIPYEENHKVFASCKLTLNLLVSPVDFCQNHHTSANERLTTAMASGGIQLVENHPCYGGGMVKNGENVIFLRSTKPKEVVAQVREIVNNFDQYKQIRQQAVLSAQKWHISGFISMLIEDFRALKEKKLQLYAGLEKFSVN